MTRGRVFLFSLNGYHLPRRRSRRQRLLRFLTFLSIGILAGALSSVGLLLSADEPVSWVIVVEIVLVVTFLAWRLAERRRRG